MKKLREENTKLKNELRKSKYIDTKILKKWKNDFTKEAERLKYNVYLLI